MTQIDMFSEEDRQRLLHYDLHGYADSLHERNWCNRMDQLGLLRYVSGDCSGGRSYAITPRGLEALQPLRPPGLDAFANGAATMAAPGGSPIGHPDADMALAARAAQMVAATPQDMRALGFDTRAAFFLAHLAAVRGEGIEQGWAAGCDK